MIFITGPLYSGKRAYIQSALELSDSEFLKLAVWDVQDLAADTEPEELLDRLEKYKIVIATEIGGGVVPISSEDRAWREAAGRLSCLLAARAETVIRMSCGLPQLLKGEWPCRSD